MGTEASPVPVEGICVRVSAMRCHSQALTIKLKRDIPLADIEAIIAGGNSWVRVVPNQREPSIRSLAPAAVSGHPRHSHRTLAQARDGRRIPLRLHRGRSVAVGGRRAAAPDYALPASLCVSRWIGTGRTRQMSGAIFADRAVR